MFRAIKFVLAVAVLFGMSAVVQAEMIDGTIFDDHFTGTSLDLTIWADQYTNNGSAITYDPNSPGLVTLDGAYSGNCRLKSKTFSFPSTWGAEVRFKMTGTLNDYDNNSASPFTNNFHGDGGIDLGVREDATGSTGSTYTLVWGSKNAGSNVTLQTGLNKDTFYAVAAFIKADGNVDIYLDDNLISTQTVFAGTPTMFYVGDTYTNVEMHMIVDYVKVGGLVPEPSTLALLVSGLIGLLCYAWRKRK